ncbi:hypothetical protein C8F01DRAFT_1165686 [Mycena amicta]|nr:hypothetical protein C8F01DRAFT_1165686 [Mycena amicta]
MATVTESSWRNRSSCMDATQPINGLREGRRWDSAARHGHLDVVKLLAEIAPPSRQGNYLGRALVCAATGSRAEVIQLLIDSYGADVNYLEEHETARTGCLCGSPRVDPAPILLAAGANPNVHSAKAIPLHVAARTLDHYVTRCGGGCEYPRRSALHRALAFDGRTDLNVLSQLIVREANVADGTRTTTRRYTTLVVSLRR